MEELERIRDIKNAMMNNDDIYIQGYLLGSSETIDKNIDIYTKENDMYRNRVIKYVNENYKESILDSGKIIDYYINNPYNLYKDILDDYEIMKKYIYKNTKTDYSKGMVNNLIDKYKNKINIIENDFNYKYENGYFNKEV